MPDRYRIGDRVKGKVVSLEDVRDNLGQIMDEKNYIVPKSVGDEMRLIAKDLLG